MDAWIYKQTITTPTGSQIDEIECPRCRYRQTVPEYIRPNFCYVCESKNEQDDFFKEKIVRLLAEDGVVRSEAVI